MITACEYFRDSGVEILPDFFSRIRLWGNLTS